MLFSGLVTMPSFAISIALIRNKYSSNICDIFAVQQGKEGCSWLVGVRHSLMRVQSRKRLFPSGGYKECGNSSAHHSKMRSARYRSAQRWLEDCNFCPMSTGTELLCTLIILWIHEQACTHRRWNPRGVSWNWDRKGERGCAEKIYNPTWTRECGGSGEGATIE